MEIIKLNVTPDNIPKKAAAYCRVSTLLEEQTSSYESQKAYYENLIKTNPKWEFAGIYADEGFSGVSKDRPDFQQLLRDAKAGKIDIILCKSISRFARNASETQDILHDLKANNVEVYFDEQKLSSFNRNTEMLLNLMAAVAEQESASISRNIQWSLQKKAERGIRRLGNNKVLGYDEIEGILIPNARAKHIKIIFEQYAAGKSLNKIADFLEISGIKTLNGNPRFSNGTIRGILLNELYCGDMRIQKQPHCNFLTKKPDKSEPYTSFYIKNHHEPIISKELWDKTRRRLAQMRKNNDAADNSSSSTTSHSFI